MTIDIDHVPNHDHFVKLYFQLQGFENVEETFDPRRCNNILKEFKDLISPQDYNSVVRDFNANAKLLLREVLN